MIDNKKIVSTVDKKCSDSGVVLLTVVLMIVLLGVLVMQYNYLSTLDVKMAAGARDSLEAYSLARAGISRAIALLQEDLLADLETAEAGDSSPGARKGVTSGEETSGFDSLEEIWAVPRPRAELGSGEMIFKIVDEDRKFNLNLILEDAVKKVDAARTDLAGGEGKTEEETDGQEGRKEKISPKKEDREEEASKKEADDEEKKTEEAEDDDEVEIDDESAEYLALKLLLEKIRERADEADGIDPFARARFDTPKGTLDAIVDWFEGKNLVSIGETERSGPVETIGELALIKGMTGPWLAGAPRREEIEVEEEGGELELIDPWAKKPFPGLKGFLTVYGDGRVNINTAPKEVLEVMLQDENDDQMSLAGDIIDAREELPFESMEDINNDEFLSEKIRDKFLENFKVRSEYFSILSEGKVGKTTARVRAVVRRLEDRVVICYWRFEGS